MAGTALRLQDAGFEYGYVWTRDQNGDRHRRWVPTGMPRLSPTFARCVFFLYGKDKKGRYRSEPEGTGVLIGVREFVRGGGWYQNMYAVSCAHVIAQGATNVRINTREGGHRFIELDQDLDWFTPTNGADLAAADITDQFGYGDDTNFLSPYWLAGRDFIQKAQIGIGDDGFMLGLFSRQPGKARNLVAAKFGNITLMADDAAPVVHEDGRPGRPAHLFDIRSRGGFSGSPVFVYRTPGGDLRDVDGGGEAGGGSQRRRTTIAPRPQTDHLPRSLAIAQEHNTVEWAIEYDTDNNLFIRLLGIHVAQYPEVVRARKMPKSKPDSEAEDEIIRSGDRLVIDGGVTVVVPAWEIIDLLNREEFVKRRAEREKRQDDTAPVPENNQLAEPAPPAKAVEGDDKHRERFTALLDAAVGKPKQGG